MIYSKLTLKGKFFIPLIILLTSLASYWRLPQQFFQQDEWHHFGQEYIWHSNKIIEFIAKDALSPVGWRFLPAAYGANYLQFSLFQTWSVGYALISLLLHFINSLLVFKLVSKFTKDRRIAALSGLIFSVSAVHSQAVTWLIQHTTTLPALTFSLVSLIFYFDYLSEGKTKFFFVFLTSLFVAIFFKETAFFLFPFITITSLYRLFIEKSKSKNTLKVILVIFFVAITYLFSLYIVAGIGNGREEVRGQGVGFVFTVSRRLFFVPLRVFAQVFFPTDVLSSASRGIVSLPFFKSIAPDPRTSSFDLFVEGVITKKMIYIVSVIIILEILLIRQKAKEKSSKDLLTYGFLWLLAASIPLMLISTDIGTFLDSRYLYLVSVGASMILAVALAMFYKNYKNVAVLVFVLWLGFNIYSINKSLYNQVETGRLRRGILTTIKIKYPYLPQEVVFYFESDRSYYGLPDTQKIPPFQSGLGETLLVWYQADENFPTEFFKDEFLWGITDQGYKKVNDRGFGYYRDIATLKSDMEKYNFSPKSIIGFRWNNSLNMLTDITQEIQNNILHTNSF